MESAISATFVITTTDGAYHVRALFGLYVTNLHKLAPNPVFQTTFGIDQIEALRKLVKFDWKL
ncbi:hypothetical protein MJD09_21780 [bacterium]|nr:hypothetical protein [bacterium]